jgi:hypothetical protein
MAVKQRGIETGAPCVGFDDVRHRSVTETVLRHHAAFIDRPKYSAGFNAGRLQPGPERLYSGASPRIESLSGKRCSGRESSFGIKL